MRTANSLLSLTARFAAVVLALLFASFAAPTKADQPPGVPPPDQSDQSVVQSSPVVVRAQHHDVSPPLYSLPPASRQDGPRVHFVRPLPRRPHRANVGAEVQPSFPAFLAPLTVNNFDGIGLGFSGPAGTFSVQSAPPDPAGDVGPNHFVQVVNSDFAVFDKVGTAIFGPVPTNTLWSGFGGLCQTDNDGDAVVLYDPIADRWVITQFAVTGANGSSAPFLQCVAVSRSPDPTGAYNRYSFAYTGFNDYPKLGVWPDAYYVTFNMFNAAGTAFLGAKACAYDRTRMLAGLSATQQCFDTGSNFGGVLPADLDGARLPPAGSPNYMLALGANSNELAFWKFHVDWSTPANSTFTGPTTIAVSSFTEACGSTGTCIPQSGTTQTLDSLSDRLMYRLAYRNFGDHEALVVNHSITAGSSVGVRWYEIRSPGTAPTIFQQGTYAPDSNFRWMGSIAMDQSGNMALGFSVSSSSLHPEIHYTGRLATDNVGLMTQGEGTIINGAGSQTGSRGLTRWGDYTMMTVDPTDDCTFWYTNQYIPTIGEFNWKTRIGSFAFPGCGAAATNDFSISASPTSLSLVQGASGTSTISTAVTSGSAESISLGVSGVPAGATATLNPTSVTTGGSSTLTVNAGTAAAGTYTLTVTGTGSSATHSTSVQLTVTSPPSNDFSISASPTSLSLIDGASGTSTISTAVTSGSAESISLSVSGVPPGATATLSPTSVTAGGSSTLTVNAGTAAPGSYALTVMGTASSATHTTTVTLTVNSAPPNDFSISASPTSLSLAQGASGTSTISTAVTSGVAATINLSVSGTPSGATASLTPTSVAAGGSSTLTVNAGTAAAGTYALTVTGTEGSATHATTVTLTVTATSSIVNGGFETGDLTGWSAAGSAAVVAGGHSGSFAARVGATTPTNGDSSIAQTFTVPAAGGTFSFWYQIHCPDTLTYDWATASLRDNVTAVTTTVLPKTCTNSGAWVQASRDLSASAGHSVTLTLVSHDDNYPGDATYTLYDDVAVSATPPPSSLVNGGFESGLTGWGSTGTTALSSAAHSGSFAARVGATTPTNGDSSVAQTFTVPAAGGTLSFWYQIHCPDTLTYDWATARLRDNVTAVTITLLPKTCTNTGAWVQASRDLSTNAGHSVTLTLVSHDDNYPGDATYTLYDDVAVGATPPPSSLVNGGFESSLTGWGSTGTTALSSTTHSDSFAAQVGSTGPGTDSSLAQTFTVPSTGGTLSFWYQVHCTDTVTYDWATVTLRNNTTGSVSTVLPRTCTNAGAWVQSTFSLAGLAGKSVTLTLRNHDDNFAGDPTYTLFDDIVVR